MALLWLQVHVYNVLGCGSAWAAVHCRCAYVVTRMWVQHQAAQVAVQCSPHALLRHVALAGLIADVGGSMHLCDVPVYNSS